MGSSVRFLSGDAVRTVIAVPMGENRLALTESQRQDGKRASRDQRRLYPDLPKCASRQNDSLHCSPIARTLRSACA